MNGIVDIVNQYGVPTVAAMGMAYFIYYIWKFVTVKILPSLSKAIGTLIKLIDRVREKTARELGWSSTAEMDAARKKKKKQLRTERKIRALEYRINKRKRNAELRRIKKEERLKRKNEKK